MDSAKAANAAVKKVGLRARKVISLQIMMMLVVAVVWFVFSGLDAAQAVVFGGLISVTSTLLLSRGVKRATAATEPSRSMLILYAGAALRFLLVLAAFAAGLAVFKLYPLGMFVGFAAAQMAYLVSMYFLRNVD